MMIDVTLHFLLQRKYRETVAATATLNEQRTTARTLLIQREESHRVVETGEADRASASNIPKSGAQHPRATPESTSSPRSK
jgi:hypothetical protein